MRPQTYLPHSRYGFIMVSTIIVKHTNLLKHHRISYNNDLMSSSGLEDNLETILEGMGPTLERVTQRFNTSLQVIVE